MSTLNNSINANSTTPLPVADGGTAVNTVTIAPTATAFAGWDANKNLSANNYLSAYTTIATAAGTTTLTVSSTYQQFFTGSTTQTVVMPVTSTLALGQSWYIVNNSTGIVTLQSSGLNNILAMPANTSTVITCILTSGTTAASWNVENTSSAEGVTSITGTANQITASASSGAVTLSLPSTLIAPGTAQVGNLVLNTNTLSSNNTNGNINVLPNGTGQVLVSNNTSVSVSGITPSVELNQTSGGGMFQSRFINSTAAPSMSYLKSRGATINSNAAVQNGDILSVTNFFADDGSTYNTLSASVSVQVSSAVSTGIVPAQMVFSTMNTSGVLNTAMSLNNAQQMILQNPLQTLYGGTGLSSLGAGISTFLGTTYTALGTFSPTFTFTTAGNLSVAYTAQTGFYLRIGGIVFVQFTMSFTPTFTTSSGTAVIASLPVSSNSTASSGTFINIYNRSANFTIPALTDGQLLISVAPASTAANIILVGSASGGINITTTNFVTGTAYSFQGTGFYYV